MSIFQGNEQSVSVTPAWALEKIGKAKEKKSTTLDLSPALVNQQEKLTKFPVEIFEISGLTALNLRRNGLATLPESLARLPNLIRLDLSNNQLSTLPESLARLPNLIRLDLSYNQLSTLPETITQLQSLRTLELSNNQLSTLSESMAQLQNLTTLNLSYNRLYTLPEWITKLKNLMALFLRGNGLSTLPKTITQLQSLRTLDLSRNQLSTLPESITQLPNLTTLDLSNNQLSALPETISQLPNLTTLDLSSNGLSTLPKTITQLPNLTTLDLSNNQLSALPETISQLQNLNILNLSYNELGTLPDALTQLSNLKVFIVEGNPLISPTIEIANQGIEAIREYSRQLEREGVDYLYEAKLLILGEGGAGKTTLANKLLDANYVLKEEKSTTGIDVLKWSFPIDRNHKFIANLWDFGGQEIYHATHQFFLTRRSLYILVADTRKDDTDFYYWLNIAELLSDGSPLLIVKNEKQDRHREINERLLRGQFDSLKEVLATNLATNWGLEEVKQEIEHYIKKLPHIGSLLPKTWVRVREKLEKDGRNYVSSEEYLSICKENGFAETKDALQLSGYLHDIGVFLHFQDEPFLRKTVILKPKWGTDAVYKVLDNKTVIKNLGRFTHTDLEMIWDTPEYENMRDELLQLMMKFKLCYEIPTQKGSYIAPQLLTENQPEYEWDENDNLLLRYSYEFMPKGILTQFIVVMHPYIQEQKIVWKSGVVIEENADAARAEVIEYYGKREIHVRVVGSQARDFMTKIRYELKKIHDTYKRLKYDELVPCNCPVCRDNPEPHFYKLSDLLEFRANNLFEIRCYKKPFHMVNVLRLLGDMIDLPEPPENKGGDTYNFYGDYHNTEFNQNIEGSTIHGSVVAAESIQNSLNTIEKSNAQDDLKEQLKQLAGAVDALVKELPKDKAEEVADDMKRLAEEATKEKPNAKWYSVSIDGLIAAAQNIGKVGDEVINLAGKVRKILTGGLL